MKKALIAAAAAAALAVVGSAAAHIGTTPGEAPAGQTSIIGFAIGHGCEGSPTTSVSIKIPAGVTAAKPRPKAGWRISIVRGKLPAAGQGLRRQHGDARRSRGHLERRAAPGRAVRHVRPATRDAGHGGQDALLPDRAALCPRRLSLDADPEGRPGRARAAGTRRQARQVERRARVTEDDRGAIGTRHLHGADRADAEPRRRRPWRRRGARLHVDGHGDRPGRRRHRGARARLRRPHRARQRDRPGDRDPRLREGAVPRLSRRTGVSQHPLAGHVPERRPVRGRRPPGRSRSESGSGRWEIVAEREAFGWHDHRIHWMAKELPPRVATTPDEAQHVYDWEIPATLDGEALAVEGSLDYAPPPSASPVPTDDRLRRRNRAPRQLSALVVRAFAEHVLADRPARGRIRSR